VNPSRIRFLWIVLLGHCVAGKPEATAPSASSPFADTAIADAQSALAHGGLPAKRKACPLTTFDESDLMLEWSRVSQVGIRTASVSLDQRIRLLERGSFRGEPVCEERVLTLEESADLRAASLGLCARTVNKRVEPSAPDQGWTALTFRNGTRGFCKREFRGDELYDETGELPAWKGFLQLMERLAVPHSGR
jgi:hypothetical protein